MQTCFQSVPGILPTITQQFQQLQPYQLEQLFKAKANGDSNTIGRMSDTDIPTVSKANTSPPGVFLHPKVLL